jgi:hypothetical protein
MNRTGIAAALTVLALAGCGSTSGARPAAPTVAQVAMKIGATAVSLEASPTLYASHEGTATWHGQQVDIATFATSALRDKWEAVAREFGPILADGPGYAVTAG